MQPHQLALWPDDAPATTHTANAGAPPRTLDAGAAFLRGHAVKPSTAQHYRETFRRLAAWSDTLPTTGAELEIFLASLRVAPTTRDGCYRDLRCFYRWAHLRLGVPNAAADLRRPRCAQPLPAILDAAQVRRLLRTKNRRDRAILAFALDTGARLHELAGVRRSDISEHQADDGTTRYTVRLRGSPDARGDWRLKTGERIVPLSRPAAQLLLGVGSGDLLWTTTGGHGRTNAGAPLTQKGIQEAIRRATLDRLGREYGPHALRHTFATMYLRAGGDIERLRRIMGHAKIETTLIYLHLVADDLAEHHDQLSPIARASR